MALSDSGKRHLFGFYMFGWNTLKGVAHGVVGYELYSLLPVAAKASTTLVESLETGTAAGFAFGVAYAVNCL